MRGLSVWQRASDTELSTEAHHRARDQVERTFMLQSHPCPDQTMSFKSHRETLLPLGTQDQSRLLSEVSHRAGSKSCSFNTEAQTEKLLLPWLASKGRKRKNPGESVRAFSWNQPSETLLPLGPTSDLPGPQLQPQTSDPKGASPFSPPSITLTSEWSKVQCCCFFLALTVTRWYEVDYFPKTQTSKCYWLRNKCYLIT